MVLLIWLTTMLLVALWVLSDVVHLGIWINFLLIVAGILLLINFLTVSTEGATEHKTRDRDAHIRDR